VATQQDTISRRRIPGNDQIGHPNRVPGLRMRHVESLGPHVTTKLAEMLDDQLLLQKHALGSTDTRADPANLFEVPVRASRVDPDRQFLSGRVRRYAAHREQTYDNAFQRLVRNH
jgi:hypothetical protein